MKKNLLYALALATSLVACTDDYTDWAAPQQNDPETAQNVSFTVTAVSSIDFANVTTEQVAVFTPTVTAEEGSKVSYKITLDGKQTLTADEKGQVVTEDLKTAIVSLYGKRPTERTMAGVVDAYVNINGQVVKTSANVEVKATLVAPVIEAAYYFIGATNGWKEGDTSLKFKHSDADVYDDPIFTITVEAPYEKNDDGSFKLDANGNKIRAAQWFNIIPASALVEGANFWSSLIGSDTKNGDDRTEAGLAYKVNGADNAFMQPASDGAKFYSITLNMVDYKMTITPLAFDEFIYVPGAHQAITGDWKPENAPALRSANFDGVYTGFSSLNGEFKFTKARDWSAEYNYSSFSTFSDGITAGGGGNIKIGTAGFYQVIADVVTGKLTTTATTWGLIGSATKGGWDTDTNMTYNASDESWSVTTDLSAGEFKFRANGEWKIDVGGSLEDLTQGGSNISIAAGNYTIKLYLTRCTSNKMYCKVTKNG